MKQQIHKTSPLPAFIDLIIFLGIMFLVRTIYIDALGFWGNALFKSMSTVGVATLLLYFRGQSWRDLGLIKPGNFLRMAGIVAITLIGTIASIMVFELFFRELIFGVETTSSASGIDFENAKSSASILVTTLIFVWIESCLEELQDRGFSLNRLESLFSKPYVSTIMAVLLQAVIFGFRHSYDFSPRSVTTGLIGLVFGIVYVLTGRNLWPLIIAHILLNTSSVLDG